MSLDQVDSPIIEQLHRLGVMEPGECIQLPPRRLPLNEHCECLVEWRSSPNVNQWQLALTKRPVSVDDRGNTAQQLNVIVRLDGAEPAVTWKNRNKDFGDWVAGALPGIVETILTAQRDELRRAVARAAVTNPKTSLKDFVPHIVILIALAAFAYMFAIVHIKI